MHITYLFNRNIIKNAKFQNIYKTNVKINKIVSLKIKLPFYLILNDIQVGKRINTTFRTDELVEL